MTYPKVIEKKYQAELINFVNVIAKEIDTRLIESLKQIDNQRQIELNLDSWVDSVDDIMESLKVTETAQAWSSVAGSAYSMSDYFDWIKSKVDDGSIEVLTVSQFWNEFENGN